MRMPRHSPAALVIVLCLAALSCGHGKQTGQCEHNFDCAAGQGCVNGACALIPCGGCQADEACGADGKCVTAQGVSCGNHSCPANYPCSAGGVCAKKCVVSDTECDPGFFCLNKSCVECANDAQCAAKTSGKVKPICDTAAGTCVACTVNFDCVKALGTGHYCDAHACKVGCKTNTDCSASLGETCDTTTNPGKCIQCKSSSDCAAQGPSASACDDTGHCVQCFGADQASANIYCGSGTHECNLANKTCVECLPANNASGLDCGYPPSAPADPHDARTCNPATFSCTDGCEVDAQCGCPRLAGGAESSCPRFPDQEHCDKNRTAMTGVTGTTLGACVQCTDNTHCSYRVSGTTFVDPVSRPKLNGSRCVNDTCLEGCDNDNDCWPDHATTNGKICHLGHTSADPLTDLDHKCVQCKCEVLDGDTHTYCELKADNTRACNNTAGGSPQVCDKETLNCRRKRQNESCDANSDCGAPAPGSTCFPVGTVIGGTSGNGFCVLKSNDDVGYTGKYCSPTHGLPGRCADFTGSCGDCTCAPGSACRMSTNISATGGYAVCLPSLCSY